MRGAVAVHLAFDSAPAARFPFDVLHEPFAGLRHNAAPANVTFEALRPHAHVALFNLLGDLDGVGTVVVHARGSRSLVPVPRRRKHAVEILH